MKRLSLDRNKVIFILAVLTVIFCFAYEILPPLILKDRMMYQVWDNLDSYGGMAQLVYNHKMYFHLDDKLPIMNGEEAFYTTFSYNLYDFLCCNLGALRGYIANKMIGVTVAFFSSYILLKKIYHSDDYVDKGIMMLISMAYAINPFAPNRTIAYAFIPVAVLLFMELYKKEKFSLLTLITFLYPVVSNFDAVLVFVMGFWLLFAIIDAIRKKKININLFICFIFMCISTIIVYFNYFKIAYYSDLTNRILIADSNAGISIKNLYTNIIHGQEHTPTFMYPYMLILMLSGLIYIFNDESSERRKYFLLAMIACMLISPLGALLLELQASVDTGTLLIDGFQWGRVMGMGVPLMYFIVSLIAFYKNNKTVKYIVILFMLFQLLHLGTANTEFNDTYNTLYSYGISRIDDIVSFKEFYDPELFEDIKKNINYDNEGVAAYGFHPSILIYNDFNTLDGYLSVHSLDYQIKFREIIKPALDKYEKYRSYYDSWGGRMYLYGELDYDPTLNKDVEEVPLYIDTKAFKELKGKYILSRAIIANAQDLNLKLIYDTTRDDSIYHMYVYAVEGA